MRRRAGGFTLIEMLAVVAMFALIASLVLPTFEWGGSRAARRDAADLGAAVDFARQRAVMTRRAHRVVLDLDQSAHWVEWVPAPPPAPTAPDGSSTGTPVEVAADRLRARQLGLQPTVGAPAPAELALVPPDLVREVFEPVPGEFGRARATDADVGILVVELAGGERADAGRVELRVTPDGAADPAGIVVGDYAGRATLRVEVEPLADVVQVVDVP